MNRETNKPATERIPPTPAKPSLSGPRCIRTRTGRWIIIDPAAGRITHLDPLFRESSWNIDELARILGICHRTLTRLVRSSLDLPAKVWLRQIRAAHAAELLRQGNKISSVARELGFRHHQDFTREFRIWMGLTPSEFQKAEQARMFPPHKPFLKTPPRS